MIDSRLSLKLVDEVSEPFKRAAAMGEAIARQLRTTPAVLEQLRRPTAMEEAMRRAVQVEAERQARDKRISAAIEQWGIDERARATRMRRLADSYRGSAA